MSLGNLDESLAKYVCNQMRPITGTGPQPGVIDMPLNGTGRDSKLTRRFFSRLAVGYKSENLRFTLGDAVQSDLCLRYALLDATTPFDAVPF